MPRDVPVPTASKQHQTGPMSARDAGDRLRGALCDRLRHGRRLRPRRTEVLLEQLRLDLPTSLAHVRRYNEDLFILFTKKHGEIGKER